MAPITGGGSYFPSVWLYHILEENIGYSGVLIISKAGGVK
jgi:hypothetical protein